MHEMSFAQQILDVVLREAEAYPGARVTRVKLKAGALLALEPASLRFCLEAIAADTPMEGAALDMVETPAEIECPVCGRIEVESLSGGMCPDCGAQAQPATGTELTIEEIELDEEDG
jgi:hydrogenase nickel incorporation protein HypA/HybF